MAGESRVCLVTGAASGIGLELAKVFAEQGMNVVLADIEQSKLTEAVDAVTALGAQAVGVLTDVGSGESVAALCQASVDRFGSVQVLCNNAGFQPDAERGRRYSRDNGPGCAGEHTAADLYPVTDVAATADI